MINLLSDERKDAIRASRVNVFLVRYTFILILAFVFIMSALYVSYTVLGTTIKSADELIDNNNEKAKMYSETSKQVAALSAKLSETKGILDQEVRFSQVLVSLGRLMPKGTVLGDLTLTPSNFSGSPVEIKAFAKSTAEAGQLQNSLQDSPLVNNVVLNSTETKNEMDGYPVTIVMTILFNRAGI
jgi:Tfp pilus assembly protein PilN